MAPKVSVCVTLQGLEGTAMRFSWYFIDCYDPLLREGRSWYLSIVYFQALRVVVFVVAEVCYCRASCSTCIVQVSGGGVGVRYMIIPLQDLFYAGVTLLLLEAFTNIRVGATPAHILSLIDVFYAQPVRIESDYVNKRTANQQGGRTPKIDRPFKEKVWTWLVKNPEVSVGKDREENDLPLSELLGSEYVWPVEPTKQKDGAQPGVTSSNGNASTVSPRLAYPAGVTAPGATPDATTNEPPNSKPKHHVFVPEERMWLAIAGHTPDRTRILPTEFTLLSIIASQKGNGIIQPELVRLSGQDKRSVPKRTDALCTKGYIEKKPIQFKASRTSLCTLKKFVGLPSYLDGSFKTPADRGKGRFHEAGDVIDFTSFLTNLFKCLQEFKVISRNDLKQELGMANGWRWRILARALRKLERIGCVKRVRAPSQYADKMKTYHPSVVLVRDPTERDVQLFHENSGSLLTPTEEEGPDSDGEDGPELGRIVKKNNASSSKGETGASRRGSIEKAGRIIPKWKPGRSIPNIVFDVINRAGPEGMSNIVCTPNLFESISYC